jgi:hypothetical protein
MWGGAGSVLDVYFEDDNTQMKFHNNLLKLVELMELTNIIDPSINLSQRIWF